MNNSSSLFENDIARIKTFRKKRLRYRRISQLTLLAVLYISIFSVTLFARWKNDVKKLSVDYEDDAPVRSHSRHKRDASVLEEDVIEQERNCTPRAVNEFPDNFFSLETTEDGGVAVHILISLYMFGVLAIVCDDYFVASLERICEDLHLQEDVAGATFMAAGSSAPEFATSVLGVFIAKSDVGVGTIVGSAVFNILFIIGCCGVFAGMIVHLTWWPLFRDCISYLLTIAALVIVMRDELVHWYEATVLVVMYILYIVIMIFNRRLESKSNDLVKRWKSRRQVKGEEDQQVLVQSDKFGNSITHEKTQFKGENEKIDDERTPLVESGKVTSSKEGTQESEKANDDVQEYESPFSFPDNLLQRLIYIIMFPVKVLMYVSIPDCKRPGCWRRLYMATFFMSIVWIAGSSYIMVWFVTIAGDALGIPDTVMGLTFLAAGTSVPDLLSSVFVARDGYGDMAVSNSIGSNIFDILMCLGVPWLLETGAINAGKALVIYSGGIIYSALTLLATVAFIFVAIAVARWRLTKGFGAMCIVIYVIVIALSCLYELNVFDDINKPSCDR